MIYFVIVAEFELININLVSTINNTVYDYFLYTKACVKNI